MTPFYHTPTPDIYTLSLHDALPIYGPRNIVTSEVLLDRRNGRLEPEARGSITPVAPRVRAIVARACTRSHGRSEEHTSELQSHVKLVCRLLLEKKKKKLRSLYNFCN